MIFAVPAALGLALAMLRVLLGRGSGVAAVGSRSDARPRSGGVLLRGGLIALACAALQLYLTLGRGMDLPPPWRTGLLWGTYAALAGVVAANLHVRWMGLVA